MSRLYRTLAESCRWCECSRESIVEWTSEGEQKRRIVLRSMQDGLTCRDHGSAYDSTLKEDADCYASSRVAPQELPVLAFLSGQFFYLEVFLMKLMTKRWRSRLAPSMSR